MSTLFSKQFNSNLHIPDILYVLQETVQIKSFAEGKLVNVISEY